MVSNKISQWDISPVMDNMDGMDNVVVYTGHGAGSAE